MYETVLPMCEAMDTSYTRRVRVSCGLAGARLPKSGGLRYGNPMLLLRDRNCGESPLPILRTSVRLFQFLKVINRLPIWTHTWKSADASHLVRRTYEMVLIRRCDGSPKRFKKGHMCILLKLVAGE